MMLHHGTHHAGYVKAFNAAEVGFSEAQEKGDIATMLSLVPVIKFNGGGTCLDTVVIVTRILRCFADRSLQPQHILDQSRTPS